jgi:hypothetical protein
VKKQHSRRKDDASATKSDEKNSWLYAFAVLLVTSATMLLLRFSGQAFLVPEFETALIYSPTVLAGIITFYVTMKGPK